MEHQHCKWKQTLDNGIITLDSGKPTLDNEKKDMGNWKTNIRQWKDDVNINIDIDNITTVASTVSFAYACFNWLCLIKPTQFPLHIL